LIAVSRDELPTLSDRDAAEYQTPSCIRNPEQGVVVGGGTVLLTISFSVGIMKRYLVINVKPLIILWMSSEVVGSAEQLP
jgi:hypothetical protein